MLVVHRALWGVDIRSVFVSYLPRCIAKQGWQRLTASTGRGRNDPKVGYTGNVKLEDAKPRRIIQHLQGRGIRWPDGSFPPLTPTSCQGLSDSGWEKNQVWKMTPQKSTFLVT